MDIQLLERDLLGRLAVEPDLWKTLEYLCDNCNGRFAGSADERRAGDYALERFRQAGLQNVAAEPFEMRGWERGPAKLTLYEAAGPLELACIALPGSQPCDLEAEIIDVGQGTPADYQRLGSAVAGKIVLTGSDGASRPEKYNGAIDAGAVGFIFCNAQPGLLASTGSIARDLPAIGLAYEYGARIRRRLAAGPLRARLAIVAQVKTVTARNIIAELPGTDPSAGWILACGHYDGHDISQGAHDNAAASAILIEAARLLAPLRDQLKLGIRFVLFSGEELGLHGSYAYARMHPEQHASIRLVFNADVVGAAQPLVLQMQSSPELAAYFRGLPLAALDATVNDGPKSFIMNSDHFPFSLAGIQAVWAVTSHTPGQGGWVHTAGDTLDKVEPRLLRQAAGTIIRLLLRMSADPTGLPTVRKTPEQVKQAVSEAGFEKPLRATGRWPF